MTVRMKLKNSRVTSTKSWRKWWENSRTSNSSLVSQSNFLEVADQLFLHLWIFSLWRESNLQEKNRQTRQETKYKYFYVCLSSSCLTEDHWISLLYRKVTNVLIFSRWEHGSRRNDLYGRIQGRQWHRKAGVVLLQTWFERGKVLENKKRSVCSVYNSYVLHPSHFFNERKNY